jgi:putative flippase GtrA
MIPSSSARFARFADIGVIGWIVQLAALSALVGLGVHYALATAMAVEITILHNFAWHRQYTWRDGAET